jgi:hypothetical protein
MAALAVLVLLGVSAAAAAEQTVFLVRPGDTLAQIQPEPEEVYLVRPDLPGHFCLENETQLDRSAATTTIGMFIVICVNRSGRVVSYAARRDISTFVGGIELYRFMRDVKAEILALPGARIVLDDPTELRARVGYAKYYVREDDAAVWMGWIDGSP